MVLILTGTDIRRMLVDPSACNDAIDAVERAIVEDYVRGRSTCSRPWRTRSAPRGNAAIGVRFDALLRPALDSLTSLDAFKTLLQSVPAAVGCRHLLPEEATTLTIMGCDAQVQSYVYMIAATMPNLSRLCLWGRNRQSDESWVTDLKANLGLDVIDCPTLSRACPDADVTVILPGGDKPLLTHDVSLPAGSLVISVAGGGFHVLGRSKRLVEPVNAGRLSIPDSPASAESGGAHQHDGPVGLAEIALGKQEIRESKDDIVVYDIVGPAIWDAAILQWLRSCATHRSIGKQLEL